MTKYLFIIIAFLTFAIPCQAGNTVNHVGNVIEISAIDSDWTWTDTLPERSDGIKVKSIQFNPGAADDVLVIEEASASGPRSVYFKCADTTVQKTKYFDDVKIKPFLDESDCTLSEGATVIIIFTYR